ncbi:MAG: hypothetical protein ACJ707_06145 [Nitrososphaera sp.]
MIVDVTRHYYMLGVAGIAFVIAASLVPSLFAQQVDSPQFNITSTDAPVLTNASKNGVYSVELKWPEVVSDAEGALQVEIVFNNASAPQPTSDTIPQREPNASGSGDVETAVTVPAILGGQPIPVESYDMAIYTPDGRKLWEKLDQPGQGGRATQRIELNSNYTGPVTIGISDIRQSGSTGMSTTGADNTDSVSFNANVTRAIPEFPVVPLLLAIGIITAIAIQRQRQWIM